MDYKHIAAVGGFAVSLIMGTVLFADTNPDFYVSPLGDDSNSGLSQEAPFKTLERARKAVLEKKNKGEDKNILVRLMGGEYFLRKTFSLGAEDSAPQGGRIVYEALESAPAVFSGGVEITGWQRCANPPKGFKKEFINNLWEADVSDILALREENLGSEYVKLRGNKILTLYSSDGTRLPRAKSEKFFTGICKYKNGKFDRTRFSVSSEAGFNLDSLLESEAVLREHAPWHMSIMPITAVEKAASGNLMVSTSVRSIYETATHSRNYKNAYFENYAPALDEEGEWIFSNGKIYMISQDKPIGVRAPVMIELVRIFGDQNADAHAPDTPVSGITIRGIRFAHTERFSPNVEDFTRSTQHEWEYYDLPTAALRLRITKDCLIEGCIFEDLADGGVRMDLTTLGCFVRSCVFRNLGGSGVLLSGYGMGWKKATDSNRIENCLFARCSQTFWHRSAVYVSMAKNTLVRNNTVRDCPYNGITITGHRGYFSRNSYADSYKTVNKDGFGPKYFNKKTNTVSVPYPETLNFLGSDNIIEANDVSRTGELMGDTNTIYVSGDGAGDIVRGNYLHDMRGWQTNATMRADDNQLGMVFENNILENNVGLGLIVKGSCDIINNYFLETRRGRYTTDLMKGAVGFSIRGGSKEEFKVERNVCLVSGEGTPMPMQMMLYRPKAWPFNPKLAHFDKNIFWTYEEVNLDKAKEYTYSLERQYKWDYIADFIDPKIRVNRGVYSVSGEASRLGIKPIDTTKTGIQGAMRKKYVLPKLGSPKIVALNFERPSYEAENLIFKDGMKVRVVPPAGAECIRYTLDGSYPTEKSPELKAPYEIVLKDEGALHVAAFAKGKEDLLGDRIITVRKSALPPEGVSEVIP